MRRPEFLRHHGGATAVEFALIGPIFLLILFAIFDIGRLMLADATIDFAAQQGAEFASLRGPSSMAPASTEEITRQVRSHVRGVDSADVTVTVSWTQEGPSGNTVAVRTAYTYVVMLGLLPIPPLQMQGVSSRIAR